MSDRQTDRHGVKRLLPHFYCLLFLFFFLDLACSCVWWWCRSSTSAACSGRHSVSGAEWWWWWSTVCVESRNYKLPYKVSLKYQMHGALKKVSRCLHCLCLNGEKHWLHYYYWLLTFCSHKSKYRKMKFRSFNFLGKKKSIQALNVTVNESRKIK